MILYVLVNMDSHSVLKTSGHWALSILSFLTTYHESNVSITSITVKSRGQS